MAPMKKKSGKDTSWIITDPVPGGPLVSHVIPSYGGHIAHKLWDTPKKGGRPVLTGYHRFGKMKVLNKWKLPKGLKFPMSGKRTPVYRSKGILVEAVTEIIYEIIGRITESTLLVDRNLLLSRGILNKSTRCGFRAYLTRSSIDPDHLDAPLPRDDVVVNIETANALLDQFAVARRMEDDAEQLNMKDVGPLIDYRLSRRKPSKGPTPGNRVQRESDGLRYDDSEED
ncbi:hypothetical protein KSS87_008423 [Heliosperma pusillum]|nr:hypothetical protein KSS87_008423 [Heliosperma pusillum]